MKNIVLFTVLLFILNSKALSAFRTLEADYITNVFSQSNFIKNPNARVNTQNVTTSTGFTVARAITTPLYDTSEFNLSSTQATGNVDWATRTFDAGMKGQNCEARFTYRGFTGGTTKAQIVQGANTVATIDLLASTDPKQVSINFPCGGLAQSTSFRIARSVAAFSGTNEIGGIYVGLATNMANVAQAENVVRAYSSATQTLTANTYNTIIYGNEQLDAYGEYDNTTGIFTAKRDGNYLINASISVTASSCPVDGNMAINITKNDVPTGLGSIQVDKFTESTTSYQRIVHANGIVPLSIGETIRIKFYPCASVTKTVNAFTNIFTISRFPSSSELVVKPETQNVWGGVVYTNQAQNLFFGAAEPTSQSPFTNAIWNQPTLLKGKAKVTTTNSGNDLGFSIDLPAGSYKLDISGLLYASVYSSGGGSPNDQSYCTFKVVETTTSQEVSRTIKNSILTAWSSFVVTEASAYSTSYSGVFNNLSYGTRNFRLEAVKTFDNSSSNNGSCYASSSSSSSTISFTITPLDQPSNSALYVQGPVLGAQTGAAIPSGYLGQSKSASGSVTRTSNIATYTDINGATLSLEAGSWLVCSYGSEFYQNLTTSGVLVRMNMRIRNTTDSTDIAAQTHRGLYNVTHSENGITFSMCSPVSVTSTKTIVTQCNASADIGTFTFGQHYCEASLNAIRLN